jgi:hypothetical protein
MSVFFAIFPFFERSLSSTILFLIDATLDLFFIFSSKAVLLGVLVSTVDFSLLLFSRFSFFLYLTLQQVIPYVKYQ